VSRYKPYPKYKEGGVEWLGKVPEHWDVTKIKYTAPYQVGWTPPTKNSENFEGTNLWVTIGDLNKKVITETKNCISDVAARQASMNITPKGSLLFSFKLSVGTVAFAGKDLYTNEAIASFLDNLVSDLSYLYYATPLYILQNASENIYGAKILNQELISNAILALPPKQEQTAIANFLDRETAKIDTLIDKQRQLIELLKEKRQALISHTVTKGLDPNVKMKDSGVAWLGEVPEHWEATQLKFLLSEPLMYGANESADRNNPNDPRYIRITDIRPDGTLRSDTFKSLPIEIARPYLLKHNTLLFARSGATVGKTFLYDIKWGIACFAGYLIKATFSNRKANAKFIKYYTESFQYWQWLQSNQIQATIENVSAEKYGNMYIPIPQMDEQKRIVNYLDTQTQKIDTLIEKANQAITLLQERRTALISAAVTGKIDVREEAK